MVQATTLLTTTDKDKEGTRNMVVSKILSDPSIIRNAIKRDPKMSGVAEDKIEIAVQFCLNNLHHIFQAKSKEFEQLVTAMCSKDSVDLPHIFSKGAKEGHVKALTKSIAPAVKVDRYKNFKFRIEPYHNGDLILGDNVLVFIVETAESTIEFKTFTYKNDIIRAVVLPVSSNRFLVGEPAPFPVDSLTLKNAIAMCSLEFFIGSKNTDENKRLINKIGRNALPLTEDQAKQFVADRMAKS